MFTLLFCIPERLQDVFTKCVILLLCTMDNFVFWDTSYELVHYGFSDLHSMVSDY